MMTKSSLLYFFLPFYYNANKLSIIKAFTLTKNIKTKLVVPLTTPSRGNSSGRVLSTNSIVFSNSSSNEKEPKTGWLHYKSESVKAETSLHKKPSTSSSSSIKDSRASMSSSLSTATSPRTGWLHYSDEKNDSNKNNSSKETKRNHRILSPPKIYPCDDDSKRMVITEHVISVPLSYQDKSTNYVNVFFRIVEVLNGEDEDFFMSLGAKSPEQRALDYVTKCNLSNALNLLLFLQGGPGFGSPTPILSLNFNSASSSWASNALLSNKNINKIVLMDQRGTGQSSTITKQTLELLFPDVFLLDNNDEDVDDVDKEKRNKFKQGLEDAVEYLSCFRADSIVLDAEEIKNALVTSNEKNVDQPYGVVLGQSFGGFCLMTYLSKISSPPKLCLFTGGIAPILSSSPHDLYLGLFQRVKERNILYYEDYPEDIPLVKTIIRHLSKNKVILPSGGILTPRRFLQLGLGLGGSPITNFASLHSLLSIAFLNNGESEENLILSKRFLKDIDTQQVFDEFPIYFLLHESIYADGTNTATNWAAYRALQTLVEEDSDWDYTITAYDDDTNKPVLFYGEMIFPWMCEDYKELGGYGMTALATSLAEKSTWGELYDIQHIKEVLSSKKSRACAAVFVDDMYVDFDECQKVLSKRNDAPLRDCKAWISNEFQHSGIRDDGGRIFDTLWKMAYGGKRLPS